MGGFPSFWTSAASSPVRTPNFAVHRFESGQDSLASQLRDEKDQRVNADKEIERVLREQNQALEKRIRSLSDQVGQLDRDMTDRLMREAQSLREEIKQKNTDVRQTIEKMFDELSNVKTDRTLLSSLFVEVAKCLNQDVGSKSIKGTVPEPLGGHY